MDAPTAPQEPPVATGGSAASWVRWDVLRADLFGLAVLAATATLVGWSVHEALHVEDADGFENLGVLIAAAAFGALAALGVAVWLLVRTARGPSPLDRVAGRHHDGGAPEAAARLGRWLLLVVAVPAVLNGATPGWSRDVASLVGAAAACIVGVVALVWVYTDREHLSHRRRMVPALAVAVLLAAAGASGTVVQPLRPAEVTDRVEAVLPLLLERSGASRVCAASGVVAGESASHTTEPCHDPDAVWSSPSGLDATTGTLVALLSDVVPDGTHVRARDTVTSDGPARMVQLVHPDRATPRTVLSVAATECGTRVRTAVLGSHPLPIERFLPDVEIGGACT